MFLKIFSSNIREHLVASCQQNLATRHKGTRGPPKRITESEIMRFVAFLIHMCSSQRVNLTEELELCKERIISPNEYERVRPLFSFNQQVLFDLFNESLRLGIQVRNTFIIL